MRCRGKLVKYDPVFGQHPAFTSSPWAGLQAHVILGKHEFDSQSRSWPDPDTWKILDIDGYSAKSGSFNVSHKYADDTLDKFDYNPDGGVALLAEKGTDPMDMGLWFKPYLADTNGAIEEGVMEGDEAKWYLHEETWMIIAANYYHHELWNVGVGSIQAGQNARGIVSLLPMFDWDDPDLRLTGNQGTDTDSSQYGIFSDRGTGGIMNTAASRDLARSLLGLSIGSMMTCMALDNIMINALRDNETSATNLLNPRFNDDNALDKYPYTQGDGDTRLSLRNNGVSGPDGDPDTSSDNYASYPIWTGTYNKWLFANDMSEAYNSSGGLFDSGDSITQLVYEGNNLMTTIATETGGYEDPGNDPPNPHKHPQYLSLQGLSYNGRSTISNVYTGVSASTWSYNPNLYGAEIDLSPSTGALHLAAAGISNNTKKGNGSYDVYQEWDIYPENNDILVNGVIDHTKSEAVALSYTMNDDSGWANRFTHDNNMNREIILRHPLVNLYSNQKYYEAGLAENFSSLSVIERGQDGTDNYGAIMPWSVYSPLIIHDEYVDGNDPGTDYDKIWINANYAFTPRISPLGSTDEIYWDDGSGQKKFAPGYLLDYQYDPDGGGCVFSTGTPREWLSVGPEQIAIFLHHNDVDDVTVDLIRITPALNCRWDKTWDVYAKIPSIKTLRVSLVKNYTTSNYDPTDPDNIIKSWTINMQQWQTTDVVIPVNPTLTEEDAIPLGDDTGITFQILEVWNQDYAGVEGGTLSSHNISECFGGISDIRIYGNEYTGEGNYIPIETTFAMFDLPEDNMRFNDPSAPWAIDGGAYWVDRDDQQYTRRSMNGGVYQAVMSVAQANPDVGGLHFNADNSVSFNTISTDFTAEFLADWKAEVSRMEQLQLWWMIVTISAAIIITAVTVGTMAFIGAYFVGAVTALSITG